MHICGFSLYYAKSNIHKTIIFTEAGRIDYDMSIVFRVPGTYYLLIYFKTPTNNETFPTKNA